MLLSRHLIVPAFTVFQWSLTTAYAALTPRNPAEIGVHPRDFRVIKRQIRNADYAGAPPPTTETTSEFAQPSKATTSITREAHPTTFPQGSSKDSRGIGSHARYDHAFNSATPPSHIQSFDPAKLEKYKTAWTESKARKGTIAEAAPRSTASTYPDNDSNGTYARRSPRKLDAEWWKKREEPQSHTSKSRTSRDNSKLIARAPQEAPTESSASESAPTNVPSSDFRQHDFPAHETGFAGDRRKESDSDLQLDSAGL